MTLDLSSSTPWLTDAGLATLAGGYLLEGESPDDMYQRVASTSAMRLGKPELAPLFKQAMLSNWLCCATPVLSNMGTERGLPISCFGLTVGDSIYDIYTSVREFAMLTKNGGGVGVGMDSVRGRGESISVGGRSEGIIPWIKSFDAAVLAVSQTNVRRGSVSINLDLHHTDAKEFLGIRRASGDVNRQCLNVNHCVLADDEFMADVVEGDDEARALWSEVLRTRLETGEPYIMFSDTVNRGSPESYRSRGLRVNQTNICSEITLYTDAQHTYVCCLSSLNLARWDEWLGYEFSNGMTLPELAVWFLDGVMEEFIQRGQHEPGLESAVRFAQKSRALGLGVLGWHTYLQEHELCFDTSVETMGLNHRMFEYVASAADAGSRALAVEYGEPEWCVGTGRRNTHVTALAPTMSNSIISGDLSPTIEPIPANAYALKSAKGTFEMRNPRLTTILDGCGQNTDKVWRSVVSAGGSVQHLDFLTAGQRELLLTAREINQLNVIRQAAARTPFIEQSQSLNLAFPVDVEPTWFNRLHLEAWRAGIKTLYYCRSSSVLRGDVAARYYDEDCTACEG